MFGRGEAVCRGTGLLGLGGGFLPSLCCQAACQIFLARVKSHCHQTGFLVGRQKRVGRLWTARLRSFLGLDLACQSVRGLRGSLSDFGSLSTASRNFDQFFWSELGWILTWHQFGAHAGQRRIDTR